MVDFVPGFTDLTTDNPDGPAFATILDAILAQGCASHWTILTAATGVSVGEHGRAFSLAGFTLQLDPAATLTTGWYCYALGPGIIDPNDGANVTLKEGEWAYVSTDATTTFILVGKKGKNVKLVDETTNTDTTLSDDDTLKFPVLANVDYWFKFVVHYDTPTAADFKFNVGGPASPTLVDIISKALAPGASALALSQETAFAFTAIVLTETSGTRGYIEIEGVLINGSNAGDVVFRWAQNSSNGSNTTVKAGSRVEFGVVQ